MAGFRGDPGALRSIVRFDRRARLTDDEDGQPQGDWQEFIASRRCELLPTRGGELTVGDRLAGRSSFDLKCRADPDTKLIRPSDRAVDITDPDNPRIFDIKFAEAMDGHQRWMLMQLESTTGEDGRSSEDQTP